MDMVSVVIPIYNAAQYLRKCLDSVCVQTYKNLEIICIDDDSQDDSKNILEEYQKKDRRIVLIHQDHQGAGEARNEGIRHARGEFIIFLDADDFFDKYMIEKSVCHIKKFQADMIVFGAEYFLNDDSTQRYDADWMLNRNIAGGSDFIEVKDSCGFLYDFTGCNPWNKLFRRKFVVENQLHFQKIKRSNDVFFICMALVLAKRIALLDDKLVVYRINDSGIQGTDTCMGMEYYEALKAVQKELKCRNFYDEVRDSFIRMSLRHCIDKLWKCDIPEVFEVLYEKFFEMQETLNFVAIKENIGDRYLLKKYQFIIAGKTDWKVIYNCRQYIDILFEKIMDLSERVICLERLVVLMNKKKEWKVPYEKIGNSRDLVIYGAGDAGQEIYRKISDNQNLKIVKWVDKHYQAYRAKGFSVDRVEEIKDCRFDKMIIAISEDRISDQIKHELSLKYEVDGDKIICI